MKLLISANGRLKEEVQQLNVEKAQMITEIGRLQVEVQQLQQDKAQMKMSIAQMQQSLAPIFHHFQAQQQGTDGGAGGTLGN
uniref:Uncharacterized protein n=1 Tax=Ditylenchus dipsaci TaxID=166011 RepID=A0A915D9X6_9BILA